MLLYNLNELLFKKKKVWYNNLAKRKINASRIANGLPIGSNIDYADELTLLKSLEGRKKI